MSLTAAATALALTLTSGENPARPAGGREEPARSVRGERASPPPGIVDGPTARALVAAGVRVVDVRTPAEYALGHVAGAVNIPVDELGRRAAEVGPKDAPVLLYCRSGRRSGIAAGILRGLGYERVYDLQRYDLWVASAPGAFDQYTRATSAPEKYARRISR